MVMTNDDEAYVAEKLVAAVNVLIAGAGRVRERLFEASTYVLSIRPEQIADKGLRRDFEWLHAHLNSAQPIGSEGTVTATLRDIDDDDAGAIARRILDLYSRAVLAAGEGRDPVVAASDRLPVDDAGPETQPGEGFDDEREALGQIIARPAVKLDPLPVLTCDHAEAVVLDLVQPVRPEGGCSADVGKHGAMKPAGRARKLALEPRLPERPVL
jgi:hypothetical protein